MNRTELVDKIARREPISDATDAVETLNNLVSLAKEIVAPERATRRTTGYAVQRLRNALGESQEAFANRMGLSVRTIARYEAKRPTGKVLARLEQLARGRGLKDLSNIFHRELYGAPEAE